MSKVKLIIQVADIHVRNFQRMEEYQEQLGKFIEKCKEIASDYEKDEVRIVIVGDLFHQKNSISPELFTFCSAFLRDLEKVAKVLVIAGNHDLITENTQRTDAISALFNTAQFENTFLLDQVLGYESGVIGDENINWCLYSIYDGFKKPDIQGIKSLGENKLNIGLFHGDLVGAQLYNGTVETEGIDGEVFEGCDCVMAGHIHMHQELKRGDTEIVYSSSLIQQTYGETTTKHGFVAWKIDNENKISHEFIELPTEYGLYDFSISNISDIDENKEKLKNY